MTVTFGNSTFSCFLKSTNDQFDSAVDSDFVQNHYGLDAPTVVNQSKQFTFTFNDLGTLIPNTNYKVAYRGSTGRYRLFLVGTAFVTGRNC